MDNRKMSSTKLILASGAAIILFKFIASRLFKDKLKRKCILIENLRDWTIFEKEIVNSIYASSRSVIGIDCEWVTEDDKRKPISLLQLANDSGYCVLIRLSRFPIWMIPVGLADILRDRSILKVGVGVYDDVDKLFNDYCLEVNNFLDIRYLAQDLPEMEGKGLGLKSLSKELLGQDLDKSFSLRCSNWNSEELSAEQIKYAADDAIIAAQLFFRLKTRKFSWLERLISSCDDEINSYTNLPYKQANTNSIAQKNISHYGTKTSKQLRYSKPRKKPMYDNCQLVAPDGELLCSCDKSKAEWYIYKELGEVISEDPFTVRLTFEPSGRPKLDNVFYTQQKENCCVVCGKTENYHRKLVVPSEYRKYFPNLMKKNLSHDVLLLCVTCHKRSNILDLRMRLKLEEMCDAPLMRNSKYKVNHQLSKVKSAAKALFNSGDKIPDSRKKELEKVILDHYKVESLTSELLTEALNIDAFDLNEQFVPHGLKVYQYFCKHGGLIEFEKMWRRHFLDSMQPKYMPYMWSVEHNHKRLGLQVINHEREVDFDISILGLSSELLKEIEEFKE